MAEKVLIFGHKNPDTDSITSSIVMADLETKLGNDVEACCLGKPNKETEYVLNYLGISAPRILSENEVPDGAKVILVDHNNPEETITNIDNVNILKIIDHHCIIIRTAYPLYYRAEPVGCTETILYKMYKENGIEIDKKIAILMMSAIISDTLLLKSPTCTEQDVKAVNELANIAGINYEQYGLEMLKAGTDLSSFSIEEILSLDAKQTSLKEVKTIINQVNTASIPEVMTKKAELEAGMNKIIEEKGLDLFMLLITDIVNSNSQVIALGKDANLVEKAYGVKLENNTALLKGIVSRKKQVIPIMTENAS